MPTDTTDGIMNIIRNTIFHYKIINLVFIEMTRVSTASANSQACNKYAHEGQFYIIVTMN
jgi:hypothetical protein